MSNSRFVIQQLTFDNFNDQYCNIRFPSTRYQGSKNKISNWIGQCLSAYDFDTVLDAFGGTGCISHMMKKNNKSVTYNDILKFNSIIGKALIENNDNFLEEIDIEYILKHHNSLHYNTFIQDTFKDIYFTNDENIWLDQTIANILNISNEYKQSLAFFALFQACIIKRPYNLFHRANLYVRTNTKITRSFGNKTTWDKSFEDHFINFVKEGNNAVFNNYKPCKSLNLNALDIENFYDLVYIDTPYISNKKIGTDYLSFYHFLEGICNYRDWNQLISYKYKHLPIKQKKNPWSDSKLIFDEFDKLFEHFKNSILAVSYRKDGIPTIDEICTIMGKYKNHIMIFESKSYQYALSNKNTQEILIVGN